MNFFEQGKKDLTQETEMEILQKQKHEQVFIGSMKKVSGHTMFSYNTVTKEIKVAPVKQEAMVELQKNNPNKDLPSNEVLFRIFELLHECKKNDSKTCSCYMNQYEHYANYITKHWNKK